MLQEKKIYVYFDNNVDKRIKVGCLYADFQRGKEKFSFEYDDEFFTSFLFRNFFDYDLQPYMIGAEDDCLWNAAKYVKRAEKRLTEKSHDCDAEFVTYKHGSHFVFPESLFKTIFPIGANILLKVMFKAAKEFPEECKETRIDIDKRLSKAIKEWINK